MALHTGQLREKDPQATDWPRGIDWTVYLSKIGATETVSTSTWAITGPDASLVKTTESVVTGLKKTQLKLSGGTLNARYTVTNHILTSSGVGDDRSFDIYIQNL